MKATELCYLSIAELAPLLAGRQLSPVELVTALLERTEHLEPTLNSYITLLRDEALAAARQAERELAAGEPKGPLHGIPIALKDIIYTRGIRTTGGSKILADFVPDHDATCWTRLREAGAILMGKLNCHEFAWGATSVNPHYGDTHNPWDPSRITGGSSGGSGSAVASGEVVAALGTDTGGSIRMPGSLCGIAGLKPTYGRVSRFGVIPLSWSLDHIGPMCRTVEDCAILLQALAGHDPRDPGSRNEPVPDYRQALTGDIAGLRIGVPREFFYEGLHPEVEQAVRQALKTLEGLGARLEEVSTPWASQTNAVANLVHLPEASAYHERWLTTRPQDYGADVRERLELGRLISATDYLKGQRAHRLFAREYDQLMQRVDVLAVPTIPIPAPRPEELKIQFLGRETEVRTVLSRLTRPFNMVGAPALTLPCGFTGSGLPVGLQLAGRRLDEATVLRVGHAYEAATPWKERHPPL